MRGVTFMIELAVDMRVAGAYFGIHFVSEFPLLVNSCGLARSLRVMTCLSLFGRSRDVCVWLFVSERYVRVGLSAQSVKYRKPFFKSRPTSICPAYCRSRL